jgi:hypothetical protein
MTASQRKTYFGTLWPAACKAQGWNPKDEDRRRDATMQATGQDSTSRLSQDQITLLFNHLKQLANPEDFDLAYVTANPEIALEEHRRSQIIWRVEHTAAKAGLNDAWLEQASAAKCSAHNVRCWRQLPTVELLKFSMTVSSRTTSDVSARRSSRNKRSATPLQDPCIPGAASESDDMPF